MLLAILFVILAIGFIPMIVMNLRSSNPNNGLTLAAAFSIVCTLCIAGILVVKLPKNAELLFHIYYIAHAWLFSFVTLYILRLKDKARKLWTRPMFYLSIAQTLVLLYSLFGEGIFRSAKHIVLGRNWWVSMSADGMRNPVLLIYISLTFASIVLIVLGIILEVFSTAKIYRSRLYFLIAIQVLYSSVEVISILRKWPLWISGILLMPICIGATWGALYFEGSRLTKSALTSFADSLSEGFVLYDERDRLIYVNDRLKRILPDDLIKSFSSKSAFETWVKQMDDVSGILIKKIINGNQTYYFHIHEHQIKDDIACVGTFYSLEDTTDTLQKIEAMNLVNEELERTAKMKSDFLANMSHEIRTPMNAVIGMAEMALREDLPDRALDCLNQIKTSGHNLLNIINDILDFSKIESGKMDIIPVEYEPLSEYHDIADTLMTRVGDRNLELVVNVSPDLPCRLEGDSMRIRQIMINLANNAVKFTKAGRVCVDISFTRQSEELINLLVHVKDTGMGIRKEDLTKLFVSFQQVDSKRNRLVEGTGLGLAISKSLVQAMGGHIGVNSEYGVGSDFYFEIPQKVLDNTPSITVEEPRKRFCLGLFANEYLKEDFLTNMRALGIEAGVPDFGESPESKAVLLERCFKEGGFLFAEEGRIPSDIAEFIEQNENVTAILLTPFEARNCPEKANVRAIRRPFSTFGLAMGLNNESIMTGHSKEVFSVDFTAPDARILIVDDNPVNLTVACGLLEPLKMQIETAERGSTAIELLKNDHFDLVFMDHMMPEMDGVEATKHIREEIPSAAEMPIIALTANAISGAKEMFLKNGLNDFVPKPIEVAAIVKKVKQYLPPELIVEGTPETGTQEMGAVEEEIVIPGIDTQEAIGRIGRASLYMKIAEDYHANLPDSAEEIRACLVAEDFEAYTIKVHALKSASKQVGASKLSEMAAALEKAGHDGMTGVIRRDTAALLEEAKRVHGLFDQVFGGKKETDLQELDADHLTEELIRLKSGCEELDMDVMEEVKEQISSYRFSDSQGDVATRLITAIDSMDVDACLELADELMAAIM